MPYVLDDTGLQIPTLSELLQEQLNSYLDSDEGFGPEADVSPDSPFYKIAVPSARQQASAWQGLRDLSACLDPDNATGQQLDRLGSFIALKRRPKTRSTIPARLIGAPLTAVARLSVVRFLPDGTLWRTTEDLTIGMTGTVETTLESLDYGPIDARQATSSSWAIVNGQVPGWTGVESLGDAQLGVFVESDPAYRVAFRNAARGRATYEAIVNGIREVNNVSAVYLYVNTSLVPDPATGLLGKQMRLVVQGGARTDIIRAIHEYVGAPVDTVGSVTGDVAPGNGQVLTYRFDRLKRRRAYLRLTYTGGNPLVPMPDNAESIVLAATADVVPQAGQAFNPMTFGLAGLVALMIEAPGCVTKVVAEGRLDPGDAWQEDALTIGLDEVVEVLTEPSPAVVISPEEDPMSVNAGWTLDIKVDGGAPQTATIPALAINSGPIAAALQPQLVGVKVTSRNGAVRFETVSVGATAELDGFAGNVAIELGLVGVTATGSDGDVQVVIVP